MGLNPSALTVRDTLKLIDGEPVFAWEWDAPSPAPVNPAHPPASVPAGPLHSHCDQFSGGKFRQTGRKARACLTRGEIETAQKRMGDGARKEPKR